jgi:metal-responsive CopG/Arc/MetJ family transcriptional regulator
MARPSIDPAQKRRNIVSVGVTDGELDAIERLRERLDADATEPSSRSDVIRLAVRAYITAQEGGAA